MGIIFRYLDYWGGGLGGWKGKVVVNGWGYGLRARVVYSVWFTNSICLLFFKIKALVKLIYLLLS
jgi:hypothetical protein